MIAHFPHSGTVYTPDRLAGAMTRALGDTKDAAWLDPCVGRGAFPSALRELGVPRSRITALDLDPRAADADRLARLVRGTDFIEWSEHTRMRFDRVILNPPYVPLSRLTAASLRAAALRTELPSEEPLPLKANYWSAFLLACLRVLAAGGGLAAVLPAAWDYARYAEPFRCGFPALFGSFHVYRSRTPLFGDVQEGSVVLIAHNYGADKCASRRTEASSSDELLQKLETTRATARSVVVRAAFAPTRPVVKTRRLEDVMTVRLGGVTGDAHFFLLTESERRELGLPLSAVRPALTRARHLVAPLMDASAWASQRDADERVWLFYPSAVARRDKHVKKYLRLKVDKGGCDRTAFKVSTRSPWHRTPLPARVDGFMSGMSRRGLFLVLRTMPRLTASNTLYVVRFCESTTLEQRAAWGLALLTSHVRRQIEARGRVYADGLTKVEPGDLFSVEVPEPPHSRGALGAYARATKLVIKEELEAATRVADAWLYGVKDAGNAQAGRPDGTVFAARVAAAGTGGLSTMPAPYKLAARSIARR